MPPSEPTKPKPDGPSARYTPRLSRPYVLHVVVFLLAVAGLAMVVAPILADARARVPVSTEGFLTEFGADADGLPSARWWVTHDRANLNPRHNIGWRQDAVALRDDRAELSILPGPYKGRDYAAGALKTHWRHGFGRFDVIARPDFAPGSVSAFFTYTGKGFGTRHDEIDIEFTGRSPTELHLNTFVAGKNQKLPSIELGFRYDAAPNAYGFEWTPDRVTWFVNGAPVFTATGDQVPKVPGKITASVWAAKDLDRWAGRFDPASLPVRHDVHCMSFRPLGDPGPTCTDLFLREAAATGRPPRIPPVAADAFRGVR